MAGIDGMMYSDCIGGISLLLFFFLSGCIVYFGKQNTHVPFNLHL